MFWMSETLVPSGSPQVFTHKSSISHLIDLDNLLKSDSKPQAPKRLKLWAAAINKVVRALSRNSEKAKNYLKDLACKMIQLE